MLRTLCEDLLISGEAEPGSKGEIKKKDDIETIDSGKVGTGEEEGAGEPESLEKKINEFNNEMEDRMKTLFIRIARSYGFLNVGKISSDFVHAIRPKLEVFSKKLSIK